ncbi:MAG: hypothetical protein NC187_07525 [Candidatus Amulumruptor caecigallinarius]|nr:hypothetical protein [Candidatus Amulumruptor caecigallinarius]
MRPQDADLPVAPEAGALAQASGVIGTTPKGVRRTPIYNITSAIIVGLIGFLTENLADVKTNDYFCS